MPDEQDKSLRKWRRVRKRWQRRAVWSGVLLVVIFMMQAADRTTVFPHWRVAALRWVDDAAAPHWTGRLLDDTSDDAPLAPGEIAVYMGRHNETRVLGVFKSNTFVWTYGANAIDAPSPDLAAVLLPIIDQSPQSEMCNGLRARLQYDWTDRVNWPHAMFIVLSLPLLALCLHATRLGFGAPNVDERPPARA
jgi:hypothetical protein